MTLVEDILRSAQMDLEKNANDPNGAPDNPKSGNQQDLATVANSLLQEIEQFKSTLGDSVAGTDPNQPDPNQQQQPDPNQQQPNQQQASQGNAPVEIQTPSGSIVKVAALRILTLMGKKVVGA